MPTIHVHRHATATVTTHDGARIPVDRDPERFRSLAGGRVQIETPGPGDAYSF